MRSNLGEIDSERGVLDKVSPIHQFLRVKGPRFPKAKARDKGVSLLREADSQDHQWGVL